MQALAKLRRIRQLALDRIARYEREIGLIRGEIKACDRAIRELEDLHGSEKRSNIDIKMQAQIDDKSRRLKISAGRSTIKSESRAAAIAADLADGDIAALTGASRPAVQKWHAGLMAVPRRHADKLVKHGIPLASWKRLAD